MAEPFLEFEQGQGVLRIEELRCQGGAGPMAGDSPSGIFVRDTGLAAQQRAQSAVEITLADTVAAVAEKVVHHCTRFLIEQNGLRRSNLFPSSNCFSQKWINWLCEGVARFIRRHV